jgi:hypothetical protein
LYAAVFAAVLATGVAHGLLTDRWAAAAAETEVDLDRLPLSFDGWDGSTAEADLEQLPRAGEGAKLLRRYVHRASGATVTVFLTRGATGPIVASHQPDSCYPGAGYCFAGPMTRRSVPVGPDARAHEFRVATFSKTERATPLHVRVYWSWTADGGWQVPDNPRLAFAGQRRLYKLYVIRQLVHDNDPLEGDPGAQFIQALIPELGKAFFAGP